METTAVPGVPIPVSRLVQGTVMIDTKNLGYAFELLDAVFEQGCNTFDTAHIYGGGECERALGKWINQRGIRDKVVIIDKGAHYNADRDCVTPFDIMSHLHDSLARLETDSIDLYLLHRDDPRVPVGPIVETLNENIRAGRIKAYGGSNWTHERIQEANAYAEQHGLIPFVASSPHFSLAVQVQEPWDGCLSITGEGGASARQWYRESRMPMFAWSSLAGGFLSGQHTREQIRSLPEDCDELYVRCYRTDDNLERLDRAFRLAARMGVTVAQIATAYVLSQPLNTFALVGCATGEEFRTNAEASRLKLTDDDLAWLNLEDG